MALALMATSMKRPRPVLSRSRNAETMAGAARIPAPASTTGKPVLMAGSPSFPPSSIIPVAA